MASTVRAVWSKKQVIPRQGRRLNVESLEQRLAPALFTVNLSFSLADAILAANRTPNFFDGVTSVPDRIEFDPQVFGPGAGRMATLELLNSLPQITESVEILGPVVAGFRLTITPAIPHAFGLFDIADNVRVRLADLRLTHGSAPSGGGIRNLGELTLERCVLENHLASAATGLGGGALYSGPGSRLTIRDSLFSSNRSLGDGGAVYLDEVASATLSRTGFFDNESLRGGGLFVAGNNTTVALSNCTLSGNRATLHGGALATSVTGGAFSLELLACTVAANQAAAGGGLAHTGTLGGSSVRYRNTLFANNPGGNVFVSDPQLALTAQSQGYNLSDDATGNLLLQTDNRVLPSDVRLGVRTLAGGLAPVLPLLPGSLAFAAGDPLLTGTDQRGVSRGAQGFTDIGAFQSRLTLNPIVPEQVRVDSRFPVGVRPVDEFGRAWLGYFRRPTVLQFASADPSSEGVAEVDLSTLTPNGTGVFLTETFRFLQMGLHRLDIRLFGLLAEKRLLAIPEPQLWQVRTAQSLRGFLAQRSERPLGAVAVAFERLGKSQQAAPPVVTPVILGEDGNFALEAFFPQEGSYRVTVRLTDPSAPGEDRQIRFIGLVLPRGEFRVVTVDAPVVTASFAGIRSQYRQPVAGTDPTLLVIGRVEQDQVRATPAAGSRPTDLYEFRAVNPSAQDITSIRFAYRGSLTDIPQLNIYDPNTKRLIPVRSSELVVDRVAGVISVVLDRRSTPALDELEGTIFVITVSPPSETPAAEPSLVVNLPANKPANQAGAVDGFRGNAEPTSGLSLLLVGRELPPLELGGEGGSSEPSEESESDLPPVTDRPRDLGFRITLSPPGSELAVPPKPADAASPPPPESKESQEPTPKMPPPPKTLPMPREEPPLLQQSSAAPLKQVEEPIHGSSLEQAILVSLAMLLRESVAGGTGTKNGSGVRQRRRRETD